MDSRQKSRFALFRCFQANWGVIGVALFWGTVALLNLTGVMPETMPKSLWFGEHGGDYSCIYAGAVAANEGLWDELYGVGHVKSGGFLQSRLPSSPVISRAVQKRRGNYEKGWLYPPPAAWIFRPLGWLDYPASLRLFDVLDGVALVVLMVLVRRECDAYGLPPPLANGIVLLCGINMPVGFNFQQQNISVLCAIAVVLALASIRKGTTASSSAGLVFLGVTKGFSIVWTPFLLLWRRWRVLLVAFLLSAALLTGTYAAGCRWETYRVFLSEIIPATRHAMAFPFAGVNESFPSLLATAYHVAVPEFLVTGTIVAGLAALGVGSWKAHRGGKPHAGGLADEESLCLAVSLLVFQMFSSCSWTFYRIHVAAMVPLFVHVERRMGGRVPGALLSVAFFLLWIPKSPIPHAGAIGYLLLLVFGFWAHAFTVRAARS